MDENNISGLYCIWLADCTPAFIEYVLNKQNNICQNCKTLQTELTLEQKLLKAKCVKHMF